MASNVLQQPLADSPLSSPAGSLPGTPRTPLTPSRSFKVKKNPFTPPDMPGYVGFANLPNQIHRKSVKRGFEFTLMVVGESGLGKSTLINTLFLTDLYPDRVVSSAQVLAENLKKTVKIDVSTVEIEERGVKVRLTVVDTPGYGDAIDNTDCFESIITYINEQFERYLQDESGLNRRHIVDNRVHCCFYFINPAGHGLKPLDVQFMKQLHNKVNIVPVIAKADTLTKPEVAKLKKKVMDEIQQHGIHVYPLPECDTDEEEDYKLQYSTSDTQYTQYNTSDTQYTQYSTSDTQYTQYSTSDTQYSISDTQYSTSDTQYNTSDTQYTQYSTSDTQYSTSDTQYNTSDSTKTLDLQHYTGNYPRQLSAVFATTPASPTLVLSLNKRARHVPADSEGSLLCF
ncbi:Septin-type guanine nucleotide-binding (G) domain [Trinorchestia longiramus]|nr:Septin-type guanine nucleotide-binding (G) domain [Trinorchestia longiramus]